MCPLFLFNVQEFSAADFNTLLELLRPGQPELCDFIEHVATEDGYEICAS